MELIDRYLQAVKFWLPKQQKQDIIAELSDDIHTQIEEQETQLGRKLYESDVEALLKGRGNPILVANRYLPQRYLIGPVLFPMYLFVLKTIALCYLVPWVLVWIGVILSPIYTAQHPGTSWLTGLGAMPGKFWQMAFASLGGVTVVFAILERAQAKSDFLNKWNPRKLPPVRNPNHIPLSSSSFELAANLVVLGWWASTMYSPVVLFHSGLRLMLSTLWPVFFWSFVLIALINIGLSALSLKSPYWTVSRATCRLLIDGIGGALFCWMLGSNVLSGIEGAGVSAQRAIEITNAINAGMAKALAPAIIVSVIIVCVDAYRIIRLKHSAGPSMTEAASMLTLT